MRLGAVVRAPPVTRYLERIQAQRGQLPLEKQTSKVSSDQVGREVCQGFAPLSGQSAYQTAYPMPGRLRRGE
jgi:hypothetical protein